MTKATSAFNLPVFAILASLLALGALTTPAQALNTLSSVASTGSDSNPCTRPSPCRTLQRAHDQTAAGGTIQILDPAGYNPLTIGKSISIINDGVGNASIAVASGGAGITINAGPSDQIYLRGLIVEGAGVGLNGIVFNTGASLTVENCIIRHVTQYGILFAPNAASSISVFNSLVADNGDTAIFVWPTGTDNIAVILSRAELSNNGGSGLVLYGLASTGAITAAVSDSVSTGNSTAGFYVISDVGKAPATLSLLRSVAYKNYYGVEPQGTGAGIRVAQSMLTSNTEGWHIWTGGVIWSYGDNYIDGNAFNTGSLTPLARQ